MDLRIFLIPEKFIIFVRCHTLSLLQQTFVIFGYPVSESPFPLLTSIGIILWENSQLNVVLTGSQFKLTCTAASYFINWRWQSLLQSTLGTVKFLPAVIQTHLWDAKATVEVRLIMVQRQKRGQTVLVAWPWL